MTPCINFYLDGVVLLLPLFLVAYLFFLSPEDISFAQTENRFIFGATYMTLNNPYYQALDTQLCAAMEANGGTLLTRDAAMDSVCQKEGIQELIASGVDAIFFTAVEWDASKESLEIAKKANIPVIVIDAPVQNTEFVACSILSDNYQTGVLCAEHLLSVREQAKIILLEYVTAHSGTERIQGFVDTQAGHDGFEILASLKTPCPLWKNCSVRPWTRIPSWHSMIQVLLALWQRFKVSVSRNAFLCTWYHIHEGLPVGIVRQSGRAGHAR